MTQKTVYKCDYCGSEFETENECLNHERRHTKVDKINKITYSYTNEYPVRIEVLMEDGKVISYRKESY